MLVKLNTKSGTINSSPERHDSTVVIGYSENTVTFALDADLNLISPMEYIGIEYKLYPVYVLTNGCLVVKMPTDERTGGQLIIQEVVASNLLIDRDAGSFDIDAILKTFKLFKAITSRSAKFSKLRVEQHFLNAITVNAGGDNHLVGALTQNGSVDLHMLPSVSAGYPKITFDLYRSKDEDNLIGTIKYTNQVSYDIGKGRSNSTDRIIALKFFAATKVRTGNDGQFTWKMTYFGNKCERDAFVNDAENEVLNYGVMNVYWSSSKMCMSFYVSAPDDLSPTNAHEHFKMFDHVAVNDPHPRRFVYEATIDTGKVTSNVPMCFSVLDTHFVAHAREDIISGWCEGTFMGGMTKWKDITCESSRRHRSDQYDPTKAEKWEGHIEAIDKVRDITSSQYGMRMLEMYNAHRDKFDDKRSLEDSWVENLSKEGRKYTPEMAMATLRSATIPLISLRLWVNMLLCPTDQLYHYGHLAH